MFSYFFSYHKKKKNKIEYLTLLLLSFFELYQTNLKLSISWSSEYAAYVLLLVIVRECAFTSSKGNDVSVQWKRNVKRRRWHLLALMIEHSHWNAFSFSIKTANNHCHFRTESVCDEKSISLSHAYIDTGRHPTCEWMCRWLNYFLWKRKIFCLHVDFSLCVAFNYNYNNICRRLLNHPCVSNACSD